MKQVSKPVVMAIPYIKPHMGTPLWKKGISVEILVDPNVKSSRKKVSVKSEIPDEYCGRNQVPFQLNVMKLIFPY